MYFLAVTLYCYGVIYKDKNKTLVSILNKSQKEFESSKMLLHPILQIYSLQ